MRAVLVAKFVLSTIFSKWLCPPAPKVALPWPSVLASCFLEHARVYSRRLGQILNTFLQLYSFLPQAKTKTAALVWTVSIARSKAAVLVMSVQVKAEPPPARSPVLQLWKKRPLCLCLQACLLEFSKAKIFDHEGLLQQMQDHKAQLEAPPAQEPPPLQEAWVVLRPILFIAAAAAAGVPEGELGSSRRESGRRMSRAPTRSSGRGTGSRGRGSCEAGSAAALPGSCPWFADLLPGYLA